MSINDAEKKKEEKRLAKLWGDFLAGIISSAQYSSLTHRKVTRAGKRIYSKYTKAHLAQMQARGIPVKKPKQAKQINEMHAKWATAKSLREIKVVPAL